MCGLVVKKADEVKLDIEVIHSPVGRVPEHADVIVTHKSLSSQAKSKFPNATISPCMMFFGDPAVKGLVETLRAGNDVESVL